MHHAVFLHRPISRKPVSSAAAARIAALGLNLAGFMGVVNITVIYLALPYIDRTLHAGVANQEWIVSMYPLMEGGFTLAAGTMGDLYGRRRVLTALTWLFVVSTLGCALAPSAPFLIVMRALQGLGGAALLSLPVAILIQMLPENADHEDTIKVFSTVAGSGGIAGPVLGGILVHFWGWPSIFYLSVAMGILVLAALPFASESDRDPSMRFDFGGQILSIVSLVAASFALIEGGVRGWNSMPILAAFGIFVCGAAAFISLERRTPKPMIHLSYFRSPAFDSGLLMVAIINFLFYGVMLLATTFLQNGQHVSAFLAGFYLMPANLAFFLVNQISPWAENRLGKHRLVVVAWLFLIGGIAWLTSESITKASWPIGAGLFVMGIGFGLMWTPSCTLTMGACADADQGFASGAIALARSFFGVLGIAILGTLFTSRAQQLVATGVSQANALSQGWHLALLFCIGLTLVFGVIVYALIPVRKVQPA
ncbi:MAG TPA: MFS transporter [Candidatus Baltobacteraceae bacterium]|jgi:DHA2 family methylenomycin A resistance protein-like MFS transporter|nr:MFS transporter [Candidatus Baltobacteraceae bacterium]